jgi:hypothetical protein
MRYSNTKRPLGLALLSVLSFPIAVRLDAAAVVVEDFEVGANSGFDPFFHYSFSNDTFRIIPDFVTDSGHFLFLGRSNVGTVTFNITAEQHVDVASIDVGDRSGGGAATRVEFVGSLDSAEFSIHNSGPLTLDTTGLNLGPISQIRLLGSLESTFDNLTLSVVPEPSSIGLALCCAVAFCICCGLHLDRWRRRSP